MARNVQGRLKAALLVGLLAAAARPAAAWRPEGWCFLDWPWVYELKDGAWHWLCPEQIALTPFAAGAFRWQDAAGNLYCADYRDRYSYTQATVVIAYRIREGWLQGTLSATNLKPHFAYQLKLSGLPETDPMANEKLGFAGRWWKEESFHDSGLGGWWAHAGHGLARFTIPAPASGAAP